MTDRESLRSIITVLDARKPPAPLFPGKIWLPDVNEAIGRLNVKDDIRAGLYLWNDDIKRAHMLAQKSHTSDGSYWHAVLHRRDKDFSNSKYWYRRAGDHPVFKEMAAMFKEWNAESFVDRCEKADRGEDRKSTEELEHMQTEEIRMMLDHVLGDLL